MGAQDAAPGELQTLRAGQDINGNAGTVAPHAIAFHSLAALFPLMQGREFDELVSDIKQHGLREPIWLYDGKILDGRNRWRACKAARITPKSQEYGGDDPLGFVLSLNLHRRHLDESQRSYVASKMKEHLQSLNLDSGDLTQIAADRMNVSRASVFLADKVRECGTEELADAVERGNLAVSMAAKLASTEPEFQRAVIGKLQSGEAMRPMEAMRQVRAEAIAQRDATMPSGKYRVIYADPPWRYEHNEADDRAIENHYPTMALEDIRALAVPELCTPSAILFLWSPSPKLAEALTVVEAWGFTYRTCAVWHKPQIGMGYYFRQQHELLLVATRGDMPTPQPADRPNSHITAERAAHSAKPEAFRQLIERMYPTLPRIELFARSAASGWDAWGNQVQAA